LSPIASARRPKAFEPSYQWTRTMSPTSVFQAKRVSAYVTVTGGPTVGSIVRSAGTKRHRR